MVANAEITQIKQRFGIVGNCTGLLRAISRALQIAPTDLSVLITGESGTGKETFPQIIHANSARKHGRYIAVNCGAIPEGTVDSELFGHEKGSFTGALADRKGYFEEADGGTIFLDEIGELPMPTQARLLRVLENGEFIKVGSSKVQKTNVRIIAATNVNMIEAISENRFREDLFYRLSTATIELPPLLNRMDDILLLFRKFAADFAEKYHMPAIQLTGDAQKVLLTYRWPGNIRQLKNVTEQISIFETSREINADTLQTYLPAYDMERLPIVNSPGKSIPFGNEQELLYLVFEMKKEIDELRATIHSMERSDSRSVTTTALTTTTPVIFNNPEALANRNAPAILHDVDKEDGEIVHEEKN
ncbi:MAG: sigma-54 dependent transcriptional regulator, partial [Porphyromonadaceae bacterium]|nr:sigma-54 dependent transcriptional regulator [Porphyromonadaceae bacterium]